ncbi:MAG: mersacidin/lichenicidin family type 2 lantibiotic [Ktedonobacteraceae bacterium]|nr:mersacidin/lichenicidin family type 2 lantibiotic [Ktedonobacteraceae bacterium]MBO0789448.1 mersacidin/lichenicidin family type 2 lantibiotic [Ktedonobacteraceae bacterium]
MKLDIVRAWKDETYRNSLSAEELAQLPEHPAGAFELSEDELERIHGARDGRDGRDGWGDRSHHDRGDFQFVSAFFICTNTVVLAVCINDD